MVQGTASGVGKSVIVAALCRIFARRGYRVSPFKAQNMSLNSFVTKTGGEIGRSTAVQAMAAGIEPITAMNPILLKPKGDTTSQLILMGKPIRDVTASEYFEAHRNLTRRKMSAVRKAWNEISSRFDIVIIEGAGSPAEINLRRQDVVNMRTAKMALAPVILVADIDCGGAFASLVGTFVLLTPSERKCLGAFLFNKFRGDPTLLGDGMEKITARTNVPFLGIIPYKQGLGIQEEDAVPKKVQGSLDPAHGGVKIGVVYLKHISNFTDLDPLAWEPGVQLTYVTDPIEITGLDAIILPGTKNTSEDLMLLHRSGLADAITSAAKRGAPVVGICGGYQMIGEAIEDEDQTESDEQFLPGLGLLPVKTYFRKSKVLRQAVFSPAGGSPFLSNRDIELEGYEIHHGRTGRLRGARPAFTTDGKPEGCVSADGMIFGCYLHDLFENDLFRRNFINSLRQLKNLDPIKSPPVNAKARREQDFDKLADMVLENIDIDLLDRLARLENVA